MDFKKIKILELKTKIQELEMKIKIEPNSCSALQMENIASFQSDIQYLEYLRLELVEIDDDEKYGLCDVCGDSIEDMRLKINPSTKKCSKCK